MPEPTLASPEGHRRAAKRAIVAEVLNRKLASSYYSADNGDLLNLPESVLDEILLQNNMRLDGTPIQLRVL